jgi:hypothetical protein
MSRKATGKARESNSGKDRKVRQVTSLVTEINDAEMRLSVGQKMNEG